jgi:hypothetical protein
MAQIAVAAVMLVAQVYKGHEANKLKEEEAVGYRDAAGRTMAITSRQMAEEIRNKKFMHSRAIAVAGASGAGTDGITKLLGDLNAEGEYRVMSVLWNGMNEAEGLQYRAEAAEREGKAAETAGWINGITSAVSAYVGMGGRASNDPGAASTGFGAPPITAYSPAKGGRPTLWSAPGSEPSSGQYSPVNPKVIWGK